MLIEDLLHVGRPSARGTGNLPVVTILAIPALTDPGWLTVYIIAPVFGEIAGGGFHQHILRPNNISTT